MMPMRVLSIKYRFCAWVDPVRYDSFDIKGGRSLEAMVQTHFDSGLPYLELYVQFSSPNEALATSKSIVIREEYTTPTRYYVSGRQNTKAPISGGSIEYTTHALHSVSGWDMHLGGSIFDTRNTYWGMKSTSSCWQSTSDWGHYETSTRRDDVLSTMFTGKGTSFVADDGELEDESDVDPPRDPGLNGAEVALFSESEPISTESKDSEGVQMKKKKIHDLLRTHLQPNDALEFPDLPHRRHDHTSSSLDSDDLKVGKEFSSKDSFLGVLKQYSIMNEVNYHVVKSKSEKFKAKCVV
ncbi:hypothetical protein J1N35_044066 [Gossypium stocksii]|uniref:Uncharacterized protein n=1 Tax=Gossypium stocksii TaxID=47602 RepID=A0A9D3U8H4_9ROSI|nr:hypothetical protein J1N35_044066 [Gossypium stocksii]